MSEGIVLQFPDEKISLREHPLEIVTRAERDILGACSEIMLASREFLTLDDVFKAQKRLLAARAGVDSAASFLLARAEELSNG